MCVRRLTLRLRGGGGKKPRGRPPKGKRWDGARGRWVAQVRDHDYHIRLGVKSKSVKFTFLLFFDSIQNFRRRRSFGKTERTGSGLCGLFTKSGNLKFFY